MIFVYWPRRTGSSWFIILFYADSFWFTILFYADSFLFTILFYADSSWFTILFYKDSSWFTILFYTDSSWFTILFCVSHWQAFLEFIKPADANNGKAYEQTLLGRILDISCLASKSGGPHEFFDNPSRFTKQDHDSTEASIHQVLPQYCMIKTKD